MLGLLTKAAEVTKEYNYLKNNKDVVSFPNLGIEFRIDSEAFSLFGISIKWYGILITIGLILAFAYAFYRSKEFGLNVDRLVDCVIGGLIGGIVCARLYYVIFNFANYRNDIKEIFMIRDGGLAIYGGVIGGLLVGGLVAKWRKIKVAPAFDLAAMGFLIGQGVGRWGNFMNQEAFGSLTSQKFPFGMTSYSIWNQLAAIESSKYTEAYADKMMTAHPCFLYESLWCILGFVLLNFYVKRRKFDGEIFLMYLSWYGLGRFFIEGLRTDSLMIGSLRVSQILAAVCVIAGIALIIFFRSKIKKNEDYVLYKYTEHSKEMLALLEKDNAKDTKKASEVVFKEDKKAVEYKSILDVEDDEEIEAEDETEEVENTDDNDNKETE